MSTTIQKLRIYAMLMRIQEIQESKIRRIQHIGKAMSINRVLISMPSGPILINPKLTEFKSIEFKDEYNKIFEPIDIHINGEIQPSKYFGKPKKNYKR